MKVIFLQDTLPVPQTGNEYYGAGASAILRENGARWLIANGYARPAEVEKPSPVSVPPVVDEPPVEPVPTLAPPEPEPALDYSKLSAAQVREIAQNAGIKTTGKRKADLVSELGEL